MIEELGQDGAQIFSAKIVRNGTLLRLREECDGYFVTELDKQQVIELANDFLKLAEQME